MLQPDLRGADGIAAVTIYKHRQTGTLILWALGVSAVIMAVLGAVFAVLQPAVAIVLGISLFVLLAFLVLFGSLSKA